MAEGLIFRDSADNRVTLEYSTEVPPVVASTWTEVPEVTSITQNPEAAPRIPLTHFKSPKQEFRLGLSGDGTYDVTCNLVPTETSAAVADPQIAIMAMRDSGARRWWRITLPKAVSTSTTQYSRMFDGGVEVASLGLGGTDDAFSFNFTLLSFGSEVDDPETRAA